MKITQYLLGCSVFLIINALVNSPASAQCMQIDIGMQIDVSAGKADQTYNPNMQQQGNCNGNTSVTSGVQVNTSGSGRHRQHREVNHTIKGDGRNRRGSNQRVIQHNINLQVDLDNPADGYNPSLPSSRKRK